MGALANALRTLIPQFWRSNGAGGLTSALDARTYQEHVADAIEQLEANGTASKWYEGSGAPAPALGKVYDQYLDNDTGDTWAYDIALGWQRTGNLRGKDGTNGTNGTNGHTPVKGTDYFDGRNGTNGTNGTNGSDGADGRDGSQIYQGPTAPTAADAGAVGDKFYRWLSATEYEVYDYPAPVAAGQNPWRLRFTTPAGGGGGGTGTVKSVSVNGGAPVNPDGAGNVNLTVTGGGSSTPVDADLTANPTSTTHAASVKAVNDGLGAKADKASPAFTGTPTAPTAATNDNSTQLATTAFVKAALIAQPAGVTAEQLEAVRTQLKMSPVQLGSFTFSLADAGNVVHVNSSTPVTASIPTNAAVPFPLGTIIPLMAVSDGMVSISPPPISAGQTAVPATPGQVMVRHADGHSRTLKPWGECFLRKIGTDEWLFSGYTSL